MSGMAAPLRGTEPQSLGSREATHDSQLRGSWWRSSARVKLCMYGGLTTGVSTWMVCYLIWLAQGCVAYLPFVSDLGMGASGPVFMVGMTLTALLLLPSWFDYYQAIRDNSQCNGRRVASIGWRALRYLLPVLGVICSVSIVGVAVDPWGVRLSAHLFFATGVFDGALVFALFASLEGRSRGRHVRGALALVAIAGVAMVIMTIMVRQGYAETDFKTSQKLILHDYQAYCKGERGSWHSNAKVHLAALSEWLLLATIMAFAGWKLDLELRHWSADRSSVREVAERCV